MNAVGPPTARQALRVATNADHQRVDTAFARFDLGRADDYRRFLQAQASAFLPIEQAIEAAQPEDLLADWPERRRAHLLRADLAELDLAVPPGGCAPTLDGAAQILGAVYVLEGSRLGGQLLARDVPAGLPRRFIAASAPMLWRRLIETLDSVLVSEQQRETAISVSRLIFAMFEDGAERFAKELPVG